MHLLNNRTYFNTPLRSPFSPIVVQLVEADDLKTQCEVTPSSPDQAVCCKPPATPCDSDQVRLHHRSIAVKTMRVLARRLGIACRLNTTWTTTNMSDRRHWVNVPGGLLLFSLGKARFMDPRVSDAASKDARCIVARCTESNASLGKMKCRSTDGMSVSTSRCRCSHSHIPRLL